MTYVHELDEWPAFRWDKNVVNEPLSEVRYKQGLLVGQMKGLGFPLRSEAVLQTMTQDVLKTSAIEGELLDGQQVRSSVARKLGMDIAGAVPSDSQVDGVVDVLMDATQNFEAKLTRKRLYQWHKLLFPTGFSGQSKIRVGAWRKDEKGPMQVVSGPVGNTFVHFEAPPASKVPREMTEFLKWFNSDGNMNQILKAAISHLWFVTIHPFDDGNGRITRAISDLSLARSDQSSQRFYSMSSQILAERSDYYSVLEETQKGDLEVTEWMLWYLGCLERSFTRSNDILENVYAKSRFWQKHADVVMNERQIQMANRLLDGFNGKLNAKKWGKIAKVSHDTANRDIGELVDKDVLIKVAGGRSTSYELAPF